MHPSENQEFHAGERLRRWNWSGHECEGDLRNAEPLLNAMLAGVGNSGASVRRQTVENFLPHGVTLVLILSESHFVVSTWPEFNFASIDIALCNDSVNLEELTGPLLSLLAARREESGLNTTRMCSRGELLTQNLSLIHI